MIHTVLPHNQPAVAVWSAGVTACCRVFLGVSGAIRHAAVRMKTGLDGLSTRRCAMALLVGVAAFGVNRADAALVRHLNANGVLTGASGVDLLGQLYDVSFRTGTCFEVFNGCVAGSTESFLGQFGANEASKALLSQVLLDVEEGNFDSEPWLTSGCTPPCHIFTPSAFTGDEGFFMASILINNSGNSLDLIGSTSTIYPDTFLGFEQRWAVWTRQASAVPEPGTLTLLGAAGLALAWTRRRRTGSSSRPADRLSQEFSQAAGA